MSDELVFCEETEAQAPDEHPPWNILIVDDEEEVHRVTRLALRNVFIEERALHFTSAYSAAEARELLDGPVRFSVALLDVVMETEHAGLDLVRYIRDELQDKALRIVLRTGQPGQAPELQVIRTYDIDDYKDKTELTALKLYTLMHSCLRSFRDIEALQKSRIGLQKVIRASRGIYEKQALGEFVDAAVEQLKYLLNLDDTVVYLFDVEAYHYRRERLEQFCTGGSEGVGIELTLDDLEPGRQRLVKQSLASGSNSFGDNQLLIYCTSQHHKVLFFLDAPRKLSPIDHYLVNIFGDNLSIALDNIELNKLLNESQQQLIYRMGDMVESRAAETECHVQRVGLYCELMAELAGLCPADVELIKQSAPLHDLGKIGVPDQVLNKPGPLLNGEWETMREHSVIGYRMLTGSGLPILEAGATIALSHHERWDGRGYPQGLREDAIPLMGRIAAIADVFDALSCTRSYKAAWDMQKVTDYIRRHSGSRFDPELVALFDANVERFIEIRNRIFESDKSAEDETASLP